MWEYIKSSLFGRKTDIFRILREGCQSTTMPADTSSKLERLREAFLDRDVAFDFSEQL